MGMGKVKWSHLNVQLREIDFDTRIAKSKVRHLIITVLLQCQSCCCVFAMKPFVLREVSLFTYESVTRLSPSRDCSCICSTQHVLLWQCAYSLQCH
jgi:hypothetical protein